MHIFLGNVIGASKETLNRAWSMCLNHIAFLQDLLDLSNLIQPLSFALKSLSFSATCSSRNSQRSYCHFQPIASSPALCGSVGQLFYSLYVC